MPASSRTLVVAMMCALAFLAREPAAPPVTQRLFVSVDAAVALDDATGRLAAAGVRVDAAYEDLHGAVVTAHPGVAVGAVPGVRYVEPIARVATADTPAEPLYSRQSGYLSAVKAPQAWDVEKGDAGIVVAVIDTGVDVTHPDLAANIWTNPAEIPNNGIDDDANGCTDDVNGCAFVTDSAPGCPNVTNGFVRDDIGHGTFVAGVVAAAANGRGMIGVAPGVRVMPIKVLDCYGSGDSVATARGILYAVRNGAAVVNLSLGGLADAAVVRDAVATAARDYNALVVAAAGNDNAPALSFPARIPEVLAVGAASSASPSARAKFSNYGPEVDVVAVGEDVVGTMPPSRCYVLVPCIGAEPYGTGAGTSFSTPQVSGLVALMLSMRRRLSPQAVTDIVRSTATALPDGTTPGWAGAGRVDMAAALNATRANIPPGEPCTVASVINGESFTCTSGKSVRMLLIDAPDPGQCGGDWAKAAAEFIFLTPGRTVYLQYDATQSDAAGRALAFPLWRAEDGGDYNLSIVMLYVGLARASDVAGNTMHRDWARASEAWAAAARWNMWAEGRPFAGGC